MYLFITSFIFSLIFYFAVSTFTGNRGLIALINLKKDIEYNKSILKSISLKKESLNNRIIGLYEKSLDLDLLDEQAKNALGYTSPGEFMIIIDTE
ncbi:FtsB family cell division protein [Wolbachia endosymbiont of Chironomus riparius]|uniref:FtsB family cell division protein n=1 Tax=Wolbachia endosymbiont of Chironomus riparius TaxID=2883238 RepID=UPI00209F969A|nr:septum formation initiator family protein [Wolbachia endosymbiont of Chironomus riparius]